MKMAEPRALSDENGGAQGVAKLMTAVQRDVS